jgi:A/G-specific adenine glycosylase
MPKTEFAPSDLPTVMRKAFDLLSLDTPPQMTKRGGLL